MEWSRAEEGAVVYVARVRQELKTGHGSLSDSQVSGRGGERKGFREEGQLCGEEAFGAGVSESRVHALASPRHAAPASARRWRHAHTLVHALDVPSTCALENAHARTCRLRIRCKGPALGG